MIRFCRPVYFSSFYHFDNNLHAYKGDTQNIRLISQELYFDCNEFHEENIEYLAESQTKEVVRNLNFFSLYETLDIVLDTISKHPSVSNNPKNIDGKQFTLKEPRKLVNLVELLIGEINERIMDPNSGIKDYQQALLCRCFTARPFLLDKDRPQVKIFLQL